MVRDTTDALAGETPVCRWSACRSIPSANWRTISPRSRQSVIWMCHLWKRLAPKRTPRMMEKWRAGAALLERG